MKSLKEFVNESNELDIYNFFSKNTVSDFSKAIKKLWDNGKDTDVAEGLLQLMRYLVRENESYKVGILDMCNDIIAEFK